MIHRLLLICLLGAHDPNVVPNDSVVITGAQPSIIFGCTALHYCDKCGVETSCPGYGNERKANWCSGCAMKVDSTDRQSRLNTLAKDSIEWVNRNDTTWLFKRELPKQTDSQWNVSMAPVIHIDRHNGQWDVYGVNDGLWYGTYELSTDTLLPLRLLLRRSVIDTVLSRSILIQHDGQLLFGTDTTGGGGSIGYEGGGR